MGRWIKGKKVYLSNSQLCASRIALLFILIPSATLWLRHNVYVTLFGLDSSQLPERFVEHNRGSGGKVQAPHMRT